MTGTGIVRNLPFEQYQNLDGWNPSTVLHGRDGHGSMLNLNWHRHNPQPSTPGMNLGTLMHMAVLEPDLLWEHAVVWNGTRRGGAYNDFCDKYEGKYILTGSEFAACGAVAESVRAHPVAGELLALDNPGDAEVSMVWDDLHTGLRCKSRADLVLPGTIVDLKTVGFSVADHFAIRRQATKLGWHISMAARQDGHWTLTSETLACKLILVEQKPPHDVIVRNINDAVLSQGQDEWYSLLRRVKTCTESGHWPGCDEGEGDLHVWDSGIEHE